MLRRLSRIKFVFVIIIVCSQVNADVFDFGDRYFNSVGDNESIMEGLVTVLTEDQQGFIWIGTQLGLVRYDGYRFKKFEFDPNNPNSLVGNYILALWSAPDGKLWIGTIANGVSVYDPQAESFTNFQHDKDNPHSLAHNRIEAFAGDDNGGIWIATNSGLDYLPNGSNRFEHYLHNKNDPNTISDNRIRSLLIDSSKNLWIGSKDGINRLKKDSNRFERLFSDPEKADSLAGQRVDSLFEEENGRIWAGTKESGAAWFIPPSDNGNKVENDKQAEYGRFKVGSLEDNGLSHAWIYTINQPQIGEIWLGSMGGGISVIDSKNLRVKRHIHQDAAISSSISLDYVSSLIRDRSGLIWVGTWGGGLSHFNPKNNAFRTLRYSPTKEDNRSLSHAHILSMHKMVDGTIWLGTSGNGIDILHPHKGIIEKIKPQPENPAGLKDGSIMTIAQLADKSVWVGTLQAGLFKYNPHNKTFTQYTKDNGLSDNAIRYLYGDDQGELWVGTGAGLERFDPSNNSFETVYVLGKEDNINVPFEAINIIAKQSNGTLWVGTDNGLFMLKEGASSLIQVGHLDNQEGKLQHNFIVSLLVDKQDRLLVSTSEGLERLIRMDDDIAVFESLSKNLTSDQPILITDILPDDQRYIWGAEGFFHTKNKTWRRLTPSDGVDVAPHWEGAFSQTNTSTLLFGGNGLLMIKPELFQEWNYLPPIVISELKVNSKPQPLGNSEKLILEKNVKSFSVEFASLDYTSPRMNRYAYKLEGYDQNWIETDANHRNANYTNLDPGNYTLHIKGSNRLGLWSDKELSLSIEMQAKWYQTLLFKLVIFLASIGFLQLIYFLKVRQLNIRKQELVSLVNDRTLELELSNRSISTMSEIGLELSSTLELEEILNTVYTHVNRMMDASVFWIGLYQPEEQKIVFKLAIENGKRLPEFSISMNDKQRPAVWCVENKEAVIINDLEKYFQVNFDDESRPQPVSGTYTNSLMYWPLIVGGRIIGVLTVQSFKISAYSKQHKDMIRSLASTTAIAMENATLYQTAERKNKELEITYKALKKLSMTDTLTGLKNRHFLLEQIDFEVAKSLRDYHDYKSFNDNKKSDKYELIFFMLDLDHFKKVNDIHGHSAGDMVLIQIKTILDEIFRDSDFKIRWGGEEFLVIARFSNREGASILAERLRFAVEQHPFDIGEGGFIKKTCSIGFACFPFVRTQPDLVSWSQVLDIADQNLYAAKKTSRNAWVGTLANDQISINDLYKKMSSNPQGLIDSKQIELLTNIENNVNLTWNTHGTDS